MADGRSGCFKYGCIGCLTVCALCVGLMFLFGALQLTIEPEDPKPENRQLSQELPKPPAPPAPAAPDSPLLEVAPLPEQPPTTPRPGRVVLDISMAELVIMPGPADQPIRVEADFDSNNFELVEDFKDSEDGSWLYQLEFKAKRGFFNLFSSGRGTSNRLQLILPKDHPMAISADISLGETDADFGGLWLTQLNLDLGPGDHFVELREPLPYPMDSLRIDASMGSTELRQLGNGSPEVVRIDHGMGDLLVDLEGPWRRDASIDVDFSMGQCRLWLPDDVRLDLEQARVKLGERSIDLAEREVSEDAPLLTLRLTGSMGELSIEQ